MIGQLSLRKRPIAWLCDRVIAGYQRWISKFLPSACRFYPSCSVYARQALEIQPLWRALPLIGWRIIRCQPLCAGGHDPVPGAPTTGSESMATYSSHLPTTEVSCDC
ncbi:MAG TPA: membrane protein insertion efficiency factor YidD [Myxococcales bacterium]|nr:membrane protein insertion efficiency factor YidD [Myxococcales bacterium]HAN31760.1 membrane protein insertion efficiency factor YidD [Myxococcales bacterium]